MSNGVFVKGLLIGLLVGALAAPALALSDADHKKMLKDPAFAAADKELNQVWAGLKKSMPKDAFEALKEDQRAWVAKGRDEAANAKMKSEGLSRVAAYAAATRERAEALPGLARQYASPKPKASPKAGGKGTSASGTDARREAYLKAARAFVEEHKFPDGEAIEPEDLGMEDFSENKLAICDVDGDGKPELLVFFEATHMAAARGHVCGFDEKTGKLTMELVASPFLEFFDNGCVKLNASHNHGLAGEFWPYSVSKFNKKTGEYEDVGLVDAWSEEAFPTNRFDNDAPFPKEIDKTGDGFIYYIYDESAGLDGETPVDTPVYEEWVARYLSGASPVEPDWVSADVKGLKALEKK
ncbi:MAG: DUF1311 domain-containing protein [Synergistaceae bacterium]|nr:DUF1311 domain-containing protein [Synergistaceae bacterium]